MVDTMLMEYEKAFWNYSYHINHIMPHDYYAIAADSPSNCELCIYECMLLYKHIKLITECYKQICITNGLYNTCMKVGITIFTRGKNAW